MKAISSECQSLDAISVFRTDLCWNGVFHDSLIWSIIQCHFCFFFLTSLTHSHTEDLATAFWWDCDSHWYWKWSKDQVQWEKRWDVPCHWCWHRTDNFVGPQNHRPHHSATSAQGELKSWIMFCSFSYFARTFPDNYIGNL